MSIKDKNIDLKNIIKESQDALDDILNANRDGLSLNEIGELTYIGKGIAKIKGLSNIKSEELIELPGNKLAMAFNLNRDSIDVILLDDSDEFSAGGIVRRGNRIVDIPVGEELFGRVIDPLGRPADGGSEISAEDRVEIEKDAPEIMDRSPVQEPLQTGIQVIDALIPIGRGQRELIIGDRQTGKTAIAVDTMINQKDNDVICIYCCIGKRNSAIAQIMAEIKEYGIKDKTIIVKASGEDTPGLNYLAPYSATAIGEYFMDQGKDVLVVFDDLTNHARSYRELSLLMRRPPGREAYPGDIFYLHARLLERSTHLKDELGGGSLTALPILETEEQNMSAYIPTNLISITDGQIYLSPKLFREGIMPAIDVGKSVSRVGGKTQLAAYHDISGDLRLSFSQFQELEAFSRFGTKLDKETKLKLRRGRRLREVFKQKQYNTLSVPLQIAVLLALNYGVFDIIDIDDVQLAKEKIREAMKIHTDELYEKIAKGEKLKDDDKERIINIAKEAVSELNKSEENGTD